MSRPLDEWTSEQLDELVAKIPEQMPPPPGTGQSYDEPNGRLLRHLVIAVDHEMTLRLTPIEQRLAALETKAKPKAGSAAPPPKKATQDHGDDDELRLLHVAIDALRQLEASYIRRQAARGRHLRIVPPKNDGGAA